MYAGSRHADIETQLRKVVLSACKRAVIFVAGEIIWEEDKSCWNQEREREAKQHAGVKTRVWMHVCMYVCIIYEKRENLVGLYQGGERERG